MIRYLLLSCCLLLICACENRSQPENTKENSATGTTLAGFPTRKLLREPLEAQRFELPSEALQIWRGYQALKPALVLYSIHPFLQPLEPAQRREVAALLRKGKSEDFYRRGTIARSNPALSPLQTLSAALAAGYFSEIIWFFPTRADLADFSPENFRQEMGKAGFIDPAAAPDLHLLEEGIIGGNLRGVPLRIVHPLAALPKLARPALIHLDLGYFQGLYQNEVRTPVYALVHETALSLRDADYLTLDISLSYSTEGGNFSLATRFLIDALAQLLHQPELLDGELPEPWRFRSEALYAREMYQESEAKTLVAAAAAKYPEDPSLLYDNLQLLLQSGQEEAGFRLLERIVRLDPGYAEEYLALAETGVDQGWLDKSLQLIDKALACYPDNPFIRLYKIDVLRQAGRENETLPLIEELIRLNWSKVFFPEMDRRLNEMAAATRAAIGTKTQTE
jgi:hypothetical protein